MRRYIFWELPVAAWRQLAAMSPGDLLIEVMVAALDGRREGDGIGLPSGEFVPAGELARRSGSLAEIKRLEARVLAAEPQAPTEWSIERWSGAWNGTIEVTRDGAQGPEFHSINARPLSLPEGEAPLGEVPIRLILLLAHARLRDGGLVQRG